VAAFFTEINLIQHIHVLCGTRNTVKRD